MSIARLEAELADAGFDLTAPLSRDAYDASVPAAWRTSRVHPSARSVLLVGNAGRTLWSRLADAPEARDPEHPVDRYTRRVFAETARGLDPPASFALYFEPREGQFLPLIALAERAGLGTRGRIGLLLHPVYGPWISLRGVLFLDVDLVSAPAQLRSPCDGCAAPCERACHGHAVSGAGLDLARCGEAQRARVECQRGCDARRACVIGREHAFSDAQIEHHTRPRAARLIWPTDS
jgi:epoxyqueuosine reductase